MGPTRKVVDMTGREVDVPLTPVRIVSLVPSQTELLFDLDVGDSVVGLTRFCVHPKDARKRSTIVGGTKGIDNNRILALEPDLVIANLEENDAGLLGLLGKVPLFTSAITNLDDALIMIKIIGDLVNRSEKAQEMISQISEKFGAMDVSNLNVRKKALYLIWKNPWMSVGGDTFIHDLMKRAGFVNVLEDQNRYPTISDKEIKELSPEVILLSSEPYPFKDKHIEELTSLCPDAQVKLVDGEMFSWYGPRLIKFKSKI